MNELKAKLEIESAELNLKVVLATKALSNETIWKGNLYGRELLEEQIQVMKNYIRILENRIALL